MLRSLSLSSMVSGATRRIPFCPFITAASGPRAPEGTLSSRGHSQGHPEAEPGVRLGHPEGPPALRDPPVRGPRRYPNDAAAHRDR
jgi:hypothetical protein